MKFGFVLPYGDARMAAELAKEAELAGWDGFFVWEAVWGIDAWVSLTAAAMDTKTIKLGTMLSPVSRMRPWKLASETATLDNLSGGRVILAVGLGATDTGFVEFGEETDRRIRAELLDEGLDIVTGLWAGQPFSYQGEHYQVEAIDFFPPPPPIQKPRIPIWVVGNWPRPKSMSRVLRYDGILPYVTDPEYVATSAEHVAAITDFLLANGEGARDYDIILEGVTGSDPSEDAERLSELTEAGMTWWLESMWDAQRDVDLVVARIRSGPPMPA